MRYWLARYNHVDVNEPYRMPAELSQAEFGTTNPFPISFVNIYL